MSDNEITTLKNDVLQTGYVTEMIAISIFGNAGWEIYDHAYFLDKDENKGREIDLVAAYYHREANNRKSITMDLGLSVEIKKVISKPWVVFSSPLTKYEQIESLFDTSLIRLHQQEIWFKDLYNNHPVRHCKRFGRVSYQAFKKKNENEQTIQNKNSQVLRRIRQEDHSITPNFSAFVSSFKAASEISSFFRQKNSLPLHDKEGLRTYEVGVVHGLIVVDGKLYEATVTNCEDLKIEEASNIPYIFNYASKEYGYRRLLIEIVTLNHLCDYLRNYQKWIEEGTQYCLRELS